MPIVAPLVALDVLVLCLWCIAVALAIAVVMKYVGNAVRGIPAIGGALAGAMGAVAQWITSAAGKLEQGVDHLIGAAWHQLARYMDKLWHEIENHAVAILEAATIIGLIIPAIHALKALVHRLTTAHGNTDAQIKRLEREYRGIEAQIKKIDHILAKLNFKGIDAQLKALNGEIAHIDNVEIPAIRSRVGTLDGAIGSIEGYLDLPTDLTRPSWLAGIVTAALATMGLGGLSCSNFKNLLGKYACGLGNLLDDLLGLMIAGVALEAVCEFLPLIEAAFGAIAGPMVHILNEVPLGKCEIPPDSWAKLSVPNGPLPPQQTLGTFGS